MSGTNVMPLAYVMFIVLTMRKQIYSILCSFNFYIVCCVLFSCFSSSLFSNREIEACCHLLASLCSCFEQTLTIKEKCQRGSLFPPGEHRASGLFNMSACVNQYAFYGRCIGFHVGHELVFVFRQTIQTHI